MVHFRFQEIIRAINHRYWSLNKQVSSGGFWGSIGSLMPVYRRDAEHLGKNWQEKWIDHQSLQIITDQERRSKQYWKGIRNHQRSLENLVPQRKGKRLAKDWQCHN